MADNPIVKADIRGASELMARLKSLPSETSLKIVKKALRAGAQIVQRAAEGTVPVLSGNLKSSIKIKAGRNRGDGKTSIVIGTGRKWFTGPTFYGAFVEYGHKLGSRKLGDKRKQVAGEHFMKYAFEESSGEAVEQIVNTIREMLAKETQGAK